MRDFHESREHLKLKGQRTEAQRTANSEQQTKQTENISNEIIKQKINMASRKHTLPSPEAMNKKEYSNPNKKLRVSVVNLPDLPASFNTLDDDCLGNVLDFVGKKCYSTFGRVNKRCHEMFCSKGLPKETYIYGYAPLRLIIQKERLYSDIAKGVIYFNRRDVFDWMLIDESYDGYNRLKSLCWDAIQDSRLDILREVFDRANERQLKHLRDFNDILDLCLKAAMHGNLECMKFLRENECKWNKFTWYWAKRRGHDHILEYLRNNGYPTGWQN